MITSILESTVLYSFDLVRFLVELIATTITVVQVLINIYEILTH